MAIFRGTGSAATSSDQTTIDTVTQAVVDAEAARDLAEEYKDDAETAKTNAENLYGDLAAVNTAKTTAETAATTATTKASEAATSAQAAADDAAEANNSFILTRGAFLDFQTLYLGVLAEDPDEDNEGNPLEEGALYFNSTDDVMRTYDGSQWFTAFASLGGALVGTNNLSDVSDAATALVNLGLTKTAAEINGSLSSGDNISELTNDSGYITDYTVTEGDVTAHQAALSITESQISDLQSYLTDYTVTEGDVTAHQAALSITESQISDFGTYEPADATILKDADIGSTVQAYDADTAKTDVEQTFTAGQRGQVTTENDGSFDLDAGNNFTCTPTGAIDLTFTNETTGQSGMILLVNTTPQTITVDADVHLSDADLTAINVAGTYLMSYYCPDGTNVYLSTTPALTEGS